MLQSAFLLVSKEGQFYKMLFVEKTIRAHSSYCEREKAILIILSHLVCILPEML